MNLILFGLQSLHLRGHRSDNDMVKEIIKTEAEINELVELLKNIHRNQPLACYQIQSVYLANILQKIIEEFIAVDFVGRLKNWGFDEKMIASFSDNPPATIVNIESGDKKHHDSENNQRRSILRHIDDVLSSPSQPHLLGLHRNPQIIDMQLRNLPLFSSKSKADIHKDKESDSLASINEMCRNGPYHQIPKNECPSYDRSSKFFNSLVVQSKTKSSRTINNPKNEQNWLKGHTLRQSQEHDASYNLLSTRRSNFTKIGRTIKKTNVKRPVNYVRQKTISSSDILDPLQMSVSELSEHPFMFPSISCGNETDQIKLESNTTQAFENIKNENNSKSVQQFRGTETENCLEFNPSGQNIVATATPGQEFINCSLEISYLDLDD
jgi:hypothetical protein